MLTTPSGLQFKEIREGTGPAAVTGYQVRVCARVAVRRLAAAARAYPQHRGQLPQRPAPWTATRCRPASSRPAACACARVQVVVNYVAMTPEGRVFENSLEKQPFDIRVGAGQVIPGLDEGLASMRVRVCARARAGPRGARGAQRCCVHRASRSCLCSRRGSVRVLVAGRCAPTALPARAAPHNGCAQVGGVRRLYIPGSLAFPKNLKAAAGRCVHVVCACQHVWCSSAWPRLCMPRAGAVIAACDVLLRPPPLLWLLLQALGAGQQPAGV
jgi:hypothetical protein